MEALIEYSPSLLAGAWVTLQIALLSVLLAVATGLLGAACKLSGFLPLRLWTMLYTTLVRGVPDLVMMMLVFYGGQLLLNEALDRLGWDFIEIDPFVAGVLTIGFIFGAYFTETFRGAFLAVSSGQLEAGRAYGMSTWQVFRRILFPQMLRFALPGIGNNWLVLLKSTAIVSLIGLSDMTRVADQAGRATHQPFTFYLAVCVLYLALTALSGHVLGRLTKRYSAGVREAHI
ncbi:polar amino acid ABC transporter permease [Thauera phenylacetica B4P]|jgi:histidine transport system permease protein|uniref:Polar amino acid ABC transporter permease n=1 Tax=Thauera phenylacetica B4P TaxID=1234382 RepID=N6ZZ25_9RHOO|nr:ABC transporter permease [Thauera phenylacetica]ENO97364.1 polar amino acid ABC transporter permease [Thauera phenylacetica B4P]